MASKRQLKTKLQAVANIKQMTRAMQLVAATKMRKAQERALKARPYAMRALSLLSRIVRSTETEQVVGSLWQKRTLRPLRIPQGRQAQGKGKICLVVVTSDKGLCGSFNGAVLRIASRFIEEQAAKGEEIEIVAVGKKAKDFAKRKGIKLAAEFFQFSDLIGLDDALPLTQWLLNGYQKNEYKEMSFCSTVFLSALLQKALIYRLLPLEAGELEQIVENIIPKKGKYSDFVTPASPKLQRGEPKLGEGGLPYLLEPSSEAIVEELAKDLVEIAVLHLLFESNASEHSARMIAMKNATDNAENLIETLTLDLNKLRQSGITQELTEISTAKEALTSE